MRWYPSVLGRHFEVVGRCHAACNGALKRVGLLPPRQQFSLRRAGQDHHEQNAPREEHGTPDSFP